MRGSRGAIHGLVVAFVVAFAGATAGCQLLAGIEDLQLTGPAGDAATGETGNDAPLESSPTPDAFAADSGPDAVGPDAHADAPPEAGPDSSPVDAGEAATTYAAEVLSDQPLAYWHFDETSGTTAADSSGHGNDGTYVGGVTLGSPGAITGDPGTSVTFDGLTAWMSAGDLFEFAGTAPCSFEAWVDPVLDGYYHNVLSRSDGQGGATTGYLMYLEPVDAGLMDFAHYSGSTSNIAESNTPIATGSFTHLVGVYDGTTLSIYGNGVLLDQEPGTFPTPSTSSPFVVAAQSGGLTSWFSGRIDEVAVYGAALPASHIQAHYHVGIGLPP